MSDFRAVAAATMALRDLVQQAVLPVPSASVRTGRPEKVGVDHPSGVVNIFLYQTAPNTALRNCDLPTRKSDGTLVQRPRMALDLYYLLSFFGDEREQVPQLLLGLTMAALQAQPAPPAPATEVNLPGGPFVPALEFTEPPGPVSFSPVILTLEELSKFWLMFQLPYALSIAYRGSAVLLDADLPVAPPALPVRKLPAVFVTPDRAPRIDRVEPPAVEAVPGAVLTLYGSNLSGPDIAVRIGGEAAVLQSVSGSRIVAALPAGLAAGLQPVQAVQRVDVGSPPSPRTLAESNLASCVLQPVIQEVRVDPGDPGADPTAAVTVAPAAVPGQPVALLLDEWQAPAGRAPYAYQISVPPLGAAAASFSFPLQGVEPAAYLTRIEVGGTASRLSVDQDPQSPTFGCYDGPRVAVP